MMRILQFVFLVIFVNSNVISQKVPQWVPKEFHGIYYAYDTTYADVVLSKRVIIESGFIWKIESIKLEDNILYAYCFTKEKYQYINDQMLYDWSFDYREKKFVISKDLNNLVVNGQRYSTTKVDRPFKNEIPSDKNEVKSFRLTLITADVHDIKKLKYNSDLLGFYDRENDEKGLNKDSILSFSEVRLFDHPIYISKPYDKADTAAFEENYCSLNINLFVSPGKHTIIYLDKDCNVHFLGHLADFNTQYNLFDRTEFIPWQEQKKVKIRTLEIDDCIIDNLKQFDQAFYKKDSLHHFSTNFKDFTQISLTEKKMNFLHQATSYNDTIGWRTRKNIDRDQLVDVYLPEAKSYDTLKVLKFGKYISNKFKYDEPGSSAGASTIYNALKNNQVIVSSADSLLVANILSFEKFAKVHIDSDINLINSIFKLSEIYKDDLEKIKQEFREPEYAPFNFKLFKSIKKKNISQEEEKLWAALDTFEVLMTKRFELDKMAKEFPNGVSYNDAEEINKSRFNGSFSKIELYQFFNLNLKIYIERNKSIASQIYAKNHEDQRLINFKKSFEAGEIMSILALKHFLGQLNFGHSSSANRENYLSSIYKLIMTSDMDLELRKYAYHMMNQHGLNLNIWKN